MRSTRYRPRLGSIGRVDVAAGEIAGTSVIVTGAGSGIGRATALLLADQGARVIAADVSAERLAQLAADRPGLVTRTCDVTSQADIDSLVAQAGGVVQGLANVAGIMDGFLPAAEIDDATWDRVLDVNLTSMMRLTRAVLPGMIEAGRGSIVNVSSEASIRGGVAGLAYTASKHAVNGLTRSVATCYRGQGIRCNAVAPGGVRTNVDGSFRSAHAGTVLGPFIAATIPTPAEPDEVAAVIAFLLSDQARAINGSIVMCDGGWSAT